MANDAAIQGDLFRAEEMNRFFLQKLPLHMQFSSGLFKLRLLCIYLEQNRLDLAAAEVEQILADPRERHYQSWQPGAMVAVANYYLATGDPELAWHTLEHSAQVTRRFGGQEFIRKTESGIVNYWLQTGRDALAQSWADSTQLAPHVVRAFGDVEPRALRAQLLYRQHRHDEAMELLIQSIAIAQSCGNVWAELSLTVWAAVVAQATGADEAANGYLRHALELGTPGRIVRVYSSTDVDLSDAIRSLLPTLGDEARRHARSLVGESAGIEQPAEGASWPEAGFTPRESEVLTQLVLGKSNREIADTLFISERTVKKHLANLFRKTGTPNRITVALWARDHMIRINGAR
jgi:ATP/maltotriose-dependent transcriptional regulator MalT